MGWEKILGFKPKPPEPPPTPTPLPEPPKIDTGVTDRLADVYAQTFGQSSGGGGQVAVVPVGPPQSGGGGGITIGAVALLAAVGVGGYFLYKKVAA